MLKKIGLSIFAIATLSLSAQADFLRIEGVVGGFNSQVDKGIFVDDTITKSTLDINDVSGFGSNQDVYAWVRFKHPVPVIPNLKLEYNTVNYIGNMDTSVLFGDINFPIGATNSLELTEIDSILYYNILDNTFWTTLDIGVDIRYVNLKYDVEDTLSLSSYKVDESTPIPMGYLRGRVEIPTTNIGIDGEVKYIGYDGDTIADYSIKLDYTLDVFPVVQPMLEVGYRYKKYDISGNNSGGSVDVEISGVFAGIGIKF